MFSSPAVDVITSSGDGRARIDGITPSSMHSGRSRHDSSAIARSTENPWPAEAVFEATASSEPLSRSMR